MESPSNTQATRSTSRSPESVPLPSDSIMMWGAKGSGKSVYIASLVYWSPPADAARRVCVLPANSTAAEWVADRVRSLTGDWGLGTGDSAFDRSMFGAPTPAFGSPASSPQSPVPSPQYKTLTERRLDFRLYTLPTTAGPITRLLNTESRYEASLNFWDVPGEVYDGDIPPNILREMTRARGLILLINPSFVPNEGRERYYMRFFDRTLGRLKFALAEAARRGERVPFDPRTNQLTIPVAVCLSQIDRSPQFMDAEPKALFEETVGDTAPILYSWLTTFDIFKLSALGRPLRRVGDREVLDGEPRPKFVHLPISWIVARTSGEEGGRRKEARGNNLARTGVP
jgi:hypothetical protein